MKYSDYVSKVGKDNEKTFERMQELFVEKEKAELKLSQAKHRMQQVENKMTYLSKKKSNYSKARNHRLIHKGIAIETVDKNTELLSETEFYELAEMIFGDYRVKKRIAEMVVGRREQVEEEKRLLEEFNKRKKKDK